MLTDDAVRKALDIDDYDMVWQQVGYGVGILYGVFTAFGSRPGSARTTPSPWGCWDLSWATSSAGRRSGWKSFVLGRFVDGFGKMLVMGICRTTFYKQFDRLLLVAIGLLRRFRLRDAQFDPPGHGGTRRGVVLALDVLGLHSDRAAGDGARLALLPARPAAQPVYLPIDWLVVTLFTAWVVAVVFAFSWYRKWGGWSSNAFVATVVLCIVLPIVLAVWLASGYSPDEHLKRLLRTRVFILSMTLRGLMLTHLVGVLTIVGMYATELRDYPRTTAGWLMAPTTLTMASTTLLTTWFHRRTPAARLAGCGSRGVGGLCVVAVIAGQLHSEGARGLDPGLLGGVLRPGPAGLPDR